MKAIAVFFLIAASAAVEAQETAFLLRRVSSVTDSGVASYEVGKECVILENRGDVFLIGLGDVKVEVPATSVTTDRTAAESAVLEQRKSVDLAVAAIAEKNKARLARNNADGALREEAERKSYLAKQQSTLAAAEKEKRDIESAKKASIQKGNQPDSVENRARTERIKALRLMIYDLKISLGMNAGRRPE